MASLQVDYRGRTALYRIQGRVNGKAYTWRMGKVGKRKAERTLAFIEDLEQSVKLGQHPDPKTQNWVNADLNATVRAKLEKYGLLIGDWVRRENTTVSLQEMIEQFIESRSDVESSTIVTYENVKRNLIDCFPLNPSIYAFRYEDARSFRKWLEDSEGLAENTARRRCGIARQMFREAQRLGFVEANPFADISVTLRIDHSRDAFIEQSVIESIISECPTREWKLLFAFARYCGVRVPSEIENLTWADVRWEKHRIRIQSPKTAYCGKGERYCPIFPELAKHLNEERGAQDAYIFPSLRNHSNLATTAKKLVVKAGFAPWGNFWKNLRSTRETELIKTMKVPPHEVFSWLGHSARVAVNHYLQVTDDCYRRAAQELGESDDKSDDTCAPIAPNRTKSQAMAGRRAKSRKSSSTEASSKKKPNKKPGRTASRCDSVHPGAVVDKNVRVGRAGLEPATKGL